MRRKYEFRDKKSTEICNLGRFMYSSYLNFCGANLDVRTRFVYTLPPPLSTMEYERHTAFTLKRTAIWPKDEVALLLEY